MPDGSFFHRYISDTYEYLSVEDRAILSEFWTALVQAVGAIEQGALEGQISRFVDTVPDLSADRWMNYKFNSSTAAWSLSSGSTVTVGSGTVTGEAVFFSSSGATVTLANSSLVHDAVLLIENSMSTTYELGVDYTVDFESGSITHSAAGSIVVGSQLTFRYSYMTSSGPSAGFPYAMRIDGRVRSIPVLQNAITSPSMVLYENVDYEVSSGYLSLKRAPVGSLWAEITKLDNQIAYRNFGYLIDFFMESSPEYLHALRGLYYAYFTGSQQATIEQAVALLLGIPVADRTGEVVSTVTSSAVFIPVVEIKKPFEITTNGSVDISSLLGNGKSGIVYLPGIYDKPLVAESATSTKIGLGYDALDDYTAPSIGVATVTWAGLTVTITGDDPSSDVEDLFPADRTCLISGSMAAANNQDYVVTGSFNAATAGNPSPGNATVTLTASVAGTNEPASLGILTSTHVQLYIPRQVRIQQVDDDGNLQDVYKSSEVYDGLNITVAVGDAVTRFQKLTDGTEIIDKTIDYDFVETEIGRTGIQRFLTSLATTGPGNTDETLALQLLRSHLWIMRIHGSVFNYSISYQEIHKFLRRAKPAYTEYILQILEDFVETQLITDDSFAMDFEIDLTETINFNYPNQLSFAVTMPIFSFTTGPNRITTLAPHDMRDFAQLGEVIEVAGLADPADNGEYTVTAIDAAGMWVEVIEAPSVAYPAPPTPPAYVFVPGTDAEYTAAGGYPYLDISAGHQQVSDNGGTIEVSNLGGAPPGIPILSFMASAAFTSSLHFTAANNETVEVAHHADLDFDNSDPFSVSMWVRRPAAGVGDMFISKWDAAGKGWAIGINAANSAFVVLADSPGAEIIVTSANPYADINAWMHFIVTYDGSGAAAGVRLYHTSTTPNPPAFQTLNVFTDALAGTMSHGGSLHIGSVAPGVQFFEGHIDEVAMWDVALTLDEVTELDPDYSATHLGLHSRASNLVAWWRMGEHANDAVTGAGGAPVASTNQITDVASNYTASATYHHGSPEATAGTWTAGAGNGIDATEKPPSAPFGDSIIFVESPGSAHGPPNPYFQGDMIGLVHDLGDQLIVSNSAGGLNDQTFTISGFIDHVHGVRVLSPPAMVDEGPDSPAVYKFTKTKAI